MLLFKSCKTLAKSELLVLCRNLLLAFDQTLSTCMSWWLRVTHQYRRAMYSPWKSSLFFCQPWVSEGGAGGLAPWILKFSAKKVVFLVSSGGKNKFHHFWPPRKILENPPLIKNPSDAYAVSYVRNKARYFPSRFHTIGCHVTFKPPWITATVFIFVDLTTRSRAGPDSGRPRPYFNRRPAQR